MYVNTNHPLFCAATRVGHGLCKFVGWTLFILVLLYVMSPGANAATYGSFVVARDIAVANINGEIRFCEHRNLKGNVCYQEGNFFGKRIRQVADWWSPETYVQASIGRDATVTRVEPLPDMSGIVIYFE